MELNTTEDGWPPYLPLRADWTEPFWEALADGQLLLARCDRCNTVTYPPTDEHCPTCGSKHTWRAAKGVGVLWSWTTFHREYVPEYSLPPPYTVVMVELPERVRLLATLSLDADVDRLRCDDPVEFRPCELAVGVFIPGFGPTI